MKLNQNVRILSSTLCTFVFIVLIYYRCVDIMSAMTTFYKSHTVNVKNIKKYVGLLIRKWSWLT